MNLFIEHLWIWVVLAFIIACCGFSWYLNNKKRHNLVFATLLPILPLALGLSLYHGIDTDKKSIKRTLDALIAAVESDDPDAVCQFISPRADDLQKLVRSRMRLASVSRVRYRNLRIEVNDAASPPIARVQLSVVFYWKNKFTIDGFALERPVPENIQIEFELVKTRYQSWLVTDRYRVHQTNFL